MYWSIADLQCCVNFCYTARWLSYTCRNILFHILFPYVLSQNIEYCSLSCTVRVCLSILYAIIFIRKRCLWRYSSCVIFICPSLGEDAYKPSLLCCFLLFLWSSSPVHSRGGRYSSIFCTFHSQSLSFLLVYPQILIFAYFVTTPTYLSSGSQGIVKWLRHLAVIWQQRRSSNFRKTLILRNRICGWNRQYPSIKRSFIGFRK